MRVNRKCPTFFVSRNSIELCSPLKKLKKNNLYKRFQLALPKYKRFQILSPGTGVCNDQEWSDRARDIMLNTAEGGQAALTPYSLCNIDSVSHVLDNLRCQLRVSLLHLVFIGCITGEVKLLVRCSRSSVCLDLWEHMLCTTNLHLHHRTALCTRVHQGDLCPFVTRWGRASHSECRWCPRRLCMFVIRSDSVGAQYDVVCLSVPPG